MCVVVSGRDRFSWLNGVLSSDVKALEVQPGVRAQLGCALDQKGRVKGEVIVFAGGDTLHVWIPKRTADELLAAWDRYIVMEDVELTRAEGRLFFVSGAGAAEAVANSRAAPFDGGFVLESDPGLPLLEPGAVLARMIAAGHPTFGVDYDEKNYVQEAGIEGRAVSFTKGCYLGQEVVCMLQMRGYVSKRLVQVKVPEGTATGAPLSADGQVVGAITSVAGTTALAMVKWAAAKPGVILESARGPVEIGVLAS